MRMCQNFYTLLCNTQCVTNYKNRRPTG